MATLDQDDLNAIQAMISGIQPAGGIAGARQARWLFPQYLSACNWNGSVGTPPLDVSFDGTIGAGSTISLKTLSTLDGNTNSALGVLDENGLWTQDAGWTGSTNWYKVLYLIVDASGGAAVVGGTLSIVVNCSDNYDSYPLDITIPDVKAGAFAEFLIGRNGRLVEWGSGQQLVSVDAAATVLPTLAGTVTQSYALSSQTLIVVRGDSFRLTFALGSDLTGWTAYFGMRRAGRSTMVIAATACTWTDVTTGAGYVDVTAAQNIVLGEMEGEVELRNGAERNTALKVAITVIDDVVK